MTGERRINILYCEGNTDGTVGGSYFSLLYLVSGLDRRRYNPIVVFHNEHAILPRYHDAGITTLIVPAYRPITLASQPPAAIRSMVSPALKVAQKALNFANGFIGRGFRYARLLREHDIDVLHLNNSVIRNNDWMLGALLARIPCVTHERGINDHYPRLSRMFGRQLKAIICISGAVRDNLLKHAVGNDNLVTIYNGIDPATVSVDADRQTIFAEYDIAPDARVIGVVGNIKTWKGQETLIRALPAVLQDVPELVCLLVGATAESDRPYRDHLVGLARELGVERHLRFTGYQTNVANFMNAMEVVVHTSIEPEPFGRVLIEAMAMGKPVVGTRAGAVTEIVDEGKTGLTFPPGDAESLSGALRRLLMSREEADAMGRNGRARLEANFDIRANIRKTEALYESLLKSAR